MFDSSDDAGDATADGSEARRRSGAEDQASTDYPHQRTRENTVDKDTSEDAEETKTEADHFEADNDIDIQALASRFFPMLSRLDEQDICPSLKNLDLGDTASASGIPFLKAPDDWKNDQKPGAAIGDKSGIFLDDEDPAGFGDDDDDAGMLGGFDVPAETGFGEGGDAWARDAVMEPAGHDGAFQEGSDGLDGDNNGVSGEGNMGTYDPQTGHYGVSLDSRPRPDGSQGTHDDILSYFDQALRGKNWARPSIPRGPPGPGERCSLASAKFSSSSSSGRPSPPPGNGR